MICKNCGEEGTGNYCAYCGASMQTGWRYKELSSEEFLEYHNHSVILRHYALIAEEMALYSAVTKSKDYFGNVAERFIALAHEDIKLARLFYDLSKKYRQPLPEYYTFKHLSILYERRGEYNKAIDICEAAIYFHFEYDGTKGGMPTRLERLKKREEAMQCVF